MTCSCANATVGRVCSATPVLRLCHTLSSILSFYSPFYAIKILYDAFKPLVFSNGQYWLRYPGLAIVVEQDLNNRITGITNAEYMKHDVIIIGAGAAGLMAMQDLLETGRSVCLLEASSMAGGRIATLTEKGFDRPVETGAEFVHGKLPLTLSLLDKGGIGYTAVEGHMISIKQGQWQKNQAPDPHWAAFMRRLNELKTDTNIEQFLVRHFDGDRYASLRQAVQHYAEGFDLADTSKASALAAQLEWGQEPETQYRVTGGYSQLVDFLLEECARLGGVLHFHTCATHITHSPQSVAVQTNDNRVFQAAAVLVTVSAGVLQSGTLQFIPAPDPLFENAIHELGFGDVIKILLQFNSAFWTNHSTSAGFLLSNEAIPTWWNQLPREDKLLTGWLGGPAASALSGHTPAALLQTALNSLSAIFHLSTTDLQAQLTHHRVVRWQRHPYIRGGYSYETTGAAAAKKILSHPIHGNIFLA
ncbi:MAG: NAD(P)/FAD-dependent oxidoreductase, partial [Bacteroidota bacterium]